MGQAKNRGSFEQRAEQAELRNRLLKKQILSGDNQRLKNAVNMHGIQRVACSMIATRTIHEVYSTKENEDQPSLLDSQAQPIGQPDHNQRRANSSSQRQSLVLRPGGLFVPRK